MKQIIAVDLMHTVGLLLVGEEDGALLGLVLGGLCSVVRLERDSQR